MVDNDFLSPEDGLLLCSVREAVGFIRRWGYQSRVEIVSIDAADGRVLAEPVYVKQDLPGFSRSLMDGYAVIATDTEEASIETPVRLQIKGRVIMGRSDSVTVLPGEAYIIPTGGSLPEVSDAVVKDEEVEVLDGYVVIRQPVRSGDHILRRGEDFSAGMQVLPLGFTIRPQDIGVLAAIGETKVWVWDLPRVGIIPTGLELVDAETIPDSGEVREVNSYLISVFLKRLGLVPYRYPIVRDDPEKLKDALLNAVDESDMVIVSGGSAKGERDISSAVIQSLGSKDIPGIRVGPGKPIIIRIINGKPVIGLPGHPGSSFLIVILVITELIQGLKGSPSYKQYKQTVTMGCSLPSVKGREQFILVTIRDGVAMPIRGMPGLLSTLWICDGIISIPAEKEIVKIGERVDVIVW